MESEGELPKMGDAEISRVLGHIYDTALDPEKWVDAIRAACEYLDCGAGILAVIDVLNLDSTIVKSWGYDPAYLPSLNETAKSNGMLRPSLRYKIGEVGILADAMPHEVYYETENYKNWGKPQGIVDIMQVILERTPTSAAVLGFARHEKHGRLDEATRGRLAVLAQHARRALLIGKTIDLQRIETEALFDTLNGLKTAVLLVDPDMHLIHANASGHALLKDAAVLRLKDGTVQARDGKAGAALVETVRTGCRDETALSAQHTPVLLRSGKGERLQAHVLSLRSGVRRRAGQSGAAAAAIFVASVAVKFPQPIQALSGVYRLTKAEMRVLHVILEVEGVAAAATLLGVSQATVKTHLHNIFRKTGTSRQTELMKLAAGYQSPLA